MNGHEKHIIMSANTKIILVASTLGGRQILYQRTIPSESHYTLAMLVEKVDY